MAKFYSSLSDDEIATQIAILLNTYNQLTIQHSMLSIKNSAANYFVEISRTANGFSRVVGCVGLLKEGYNLSRIYHVCVHPEYRQLGIAKKLINIAMQRCETSNVYMTIRDNNIPSLRMAGSLGFRYIGRKPSRNNNHMIAIVGRETKLWMTM
jgi:ribosomal protein S18 acetylase RimI-like enzyme